MEYLKDILYVNKTSFLKTLDSIKKNWIIVFTGLVYSALSIVSFSLLGILFQGILGIFAGIIITIVTSSFISNYLYLLFNVINYNRITMQDFKEGFTHFIWKVYGVFFIGYLGSYLLGAISNILGSGSIILSLIISISILVLLNPLPETIYIKSYSPWESILYTFEFMMENWLNWIIPNILFHLGLYFLTGNMLINLFNTHISFNLSFNLRYIVMYLVGQALFSFIMIYRGHLYKLLSGSTRRKRMFMNKF